MILGRFVYGVVGVVTGEWPQGLFPGCRRQHDRFHYQNYSNL